MHSSTILAALGIFAASAMAAPSPAHGYPDNYIVTVYENGVPEHLKPSNETAADLVKRENAGVYLCTDRDFTGHCVHIVAPEYTCGKP